MLTPSQYAERYQSLDVPLDGTSATVRVTKYLNPGPRVKYRWDDKPGKPSEKHWNVVLDIYRRHVAKVGRTAFKIPFPSPIDDGTPQRVHKGFASPAEIRVVLQLVALYWNEIGSGGNFDPKASLQAYSDMWLGLFCTGFVGNYMRDVLRKKTVTGDTYIPNFGEAPYRRYVLTHISERDLLVWKNGFHIAIVDQVFPSSKGLRLRVVESSFDTAYKGLTANKLTGNDTCSPNDYTVVGQGKSGLWILQRGLNSYQKPEVYIVDPLFSTEAEDV